MRRTLARLIVCTTAVFAPLLAAAPASATGVPPMGVTVTEITNGFKVCGVGSSASIVHRWQLTVAITRSTTGPTWEFYIESTRTFNWCTYVYHLDEAAGGFVATLYYGGVGTDVAGAFVGGGWWSPFGPDESFDSGIV